MKSPYWNEDVKYAFKYILFLMMPSKSQNIGKERDKRKKNRKYLTSDFSRTDGCHFQSGGQWLLRLRIVRTGGQY